MTAAGDAYRGVRLLLDARAAHNAQDGTRDRAVAAVAAVDAVVRWVQSR